MPTDPAAAANAATADAVTADAATADAATADAATADAATADAATADAAPPWGDDFDPARAWQTITNLRAIEKERDAKIAAFEATESERVEAAKSEEQKAADRASRTETDLSAARRELYVERARRKFPALGDDLVEFLSGDDEEKILAQAERLAGIGKQTTDDDDEDPSPGSWRPVEGLTPGHGGTPPPVFDPEAIARAARARR